MCASPCRRLSPMGFPSGTPDRRGAGRPSGRRIRDADNPVCRNREVPYPCIKYIRNTDAHQAGQGRSVAAVAVPGHKPQAASSRRIANRVCCRTIDTRQSSVGNGMSGQGSIPAIGHLESGMGWLETRGAAACQVSARKRKYSLRISTSCLLQSGYVEVYKQPVRLSSLSDCSSSG
jgi:hypothetical protein